jgi:hypothetical protein
MQEKLDSYRIQEENAGSGFGAACGESRAEMLTVGRDTLNLRDRPCRLRRNHQVMGVKPLL